MKYPNELFGYMAENKATFQTKSNKLKCCESKIIQQSKVRVL